MPACLTTSDNPLGIVVHPKPQESESDTNSLDSMDVMIEPNKCDAYYSNPFEEATTGKGDTDASYDEWVDAFVPLRKT